MGSHFRHRLPDLQGSDPRRGTRVHPPEPQRRRLGQRPRQHQPQRLQGFRQHAVRFLRTGFAEPGGETKDAFRAARLKLLRTDCLLASFPPNRFAFRPPGGKGGARHWRQSRAADPETFPEGFRCPTATKPTAILPSLLCGKPGHACCARLSRFSFFIMPSAGGFPS